MRQWGVYWGAGVDCYGDANDSRDKSTFLKSASNYASVPQHTQGHAPRDLSHRATREGHLLRASLRLMGIPLLHTNNKTMS